MKRTCAQSGVNFEVMPGDLEFLKTISPTFSGVKQFIPPPTLSPDMRLRRRLAFRNQRNLYKRKSDLSGVEMISLFSPDSQVVVYENDEWWGDSWDAMSFAREFDFSKPFFRQFGELLRGVPHLGFYRGETENSAYTNYTHNMKNCYLVFGASNSEDCFYSEFITGCKDVMDSLSLFGCELCYEGIGSENCYNCSYFQNCRNCTDSFLIEDCESCSSCFLCFGLIRKDYHILNQPVGKAKYEEFKKENFPLSRSRLKELEKEFEILKSPIPHRASHVYGSEDCSGEMIVNSKNCDYCFDIKDSEDSKYVLWSPKAIRSYDCTFSSPTGVQFCYETGSSLASSSAFLFLCWHVDKCFYSIESHNSKNLFGCVGLNQKEYCILNKQYQKDDYEQLANKIVAHMRGTKEWGENFPVELSLFAYNDTMAQDNFPLSQSEIEKRGWVWRDPKEKNPVKPTLSAVPERIDLLEDSMARGILKCSASGVPFKLNPVEITYYRKLGLPPPDISPEERNRRRLAKRNPFSMRETECSKTGKKIWTNYPADSKYSLISNEQYLEDRK